MREDHRHRTVRPARRTGDGHRALRLGPAGVLEIYFSVVQRKVLTPNDFIDVAEVESRLAAVERRYEQTAKPFEWKFTRGNLTKLLERLTDEPDYRTAA